MGGFGEQKASMSFGHKGLLQSLPSALVCWQMIQNHWGGIVDGRYRLLWAVLSTEGRGRGGRDKGGGYCYQAPQMPLASKWGVCKSFNWFSTGHPCLEILDVQFISDMMMETAVMGGKPEVFAEQRWQFCWRWFNSNWNHWVRWGRL